jgi:hypothetical protein
MDVADRLHQRALGFEYEEAQAHKLKTVEYKDGKPLKETERLEIIMVKRSSRRTPRPASSGSRTAARSNGVTGKKLRRGETMTPTRSSPWRLAIRHRRGEGLSPPKVVPEADRCLL